MDDARVAAAGDLAELLLRNAAAQTSRSEHRRARRLGRLLADPAGRELLFSLTDEVMRTPDATRALHRLDALLRDGVPRSLGFIGRIYDEGSPLRVALAYEQATEWHKQNPKLGV